MQVMTHSDSSIRRWCGSCGLSSPLGSNKCPHCAEEYHNSTRKLLSVLQSRDPVEVEEVDVDAFISSLGKDEPAQKNRFLSSIQFVLSVGNWMAVLVLLSFAALVVYSYWLK